MGRRTRFFEDHSEDECLDLFEELEEFASATPVNDGREISARLKEDRERVMRKWNLYVVRNLGSCNPLLITLQILPKAIHEETGRSRRNMARPVPRRRGGQGPLQGLPVVVREKIGLMGG